MLVILQLLNLKYSNKEIFCKHCKNLQLLLPSFLRIKPPHTTSDCLPVIYYVISTSRADFDITTGRCKIKIIFKEYYNNINHRVYTSCDVATMQDITVNFLEITLILQAVLSDVKIGSSCARGNRLILSLHQSL